MTVLLYVYVWHRTLTGIVAHVKSILIAYQKKTDYKPEGTEVAEGTQVGPTHCVGYLTM